MMMIIDYLAGPGEVRPGMRVALVVLAMLALVALVTVIAAL